MLTRPTVLFAWELGGGLGHLAKTLSLANILAPAGYAVKFAVRDLREAHRLLSIEHDLVQAPLSLSTLSNWPAPSSYGEILLHAGFGDLEGLCARVRAWRSLMELCRVDLLIADHSPTAVLAARCASVPTLTIGNGFYFPPPSWPAFRVWDVDRPDRRAAARALVLQSINRCLEANGMPALSDAAAIGQTAGSSVLTYPQLDHYGPRADPLPCIGHFWLDDVGGEPSWPSGSGPRVFAYLRDGFAGSADVLKALARQNARVVVHSGAQGVRNIGATASVRATSGLVRLDRVADQADLVVCSGTDTAQAMALRGVPVLSLPMTAEQRFATTRLQPLGIAAPWIADDRKPAELDGLMARLLSPETKAAASTFASPYRSHTNRAVLDRLHDAARALATA